MARPIPKWKCEQIAADIAELLDMRKPLHWTQVRQFYEPTLPGLECHIMREIPAHLRPAVTRRLMIESRYLSARNP